MAEPGLRGVLASERGTEGGGGRSEGCGLAGC